MNRIYNSQLSGLTLNDINGQPISWQQCQGRPLLVVNVASECGLTPQYTALEALHQRFGQQEDGLMIIGCPCNQFGEQEPGDAEQIQAFVSEQYDVHFLITEKIDVNGENRHAFYQRLIGDGPDIEWNFAKFLVGGDGEVIMRLAPDVAPDAPELVDVIDALFS